MLLLSLVGLYASFTLLMEKLQLLANPKYTPSCSFNPVFSCSGPMQSWQEHALGLPNPVIGVIGFTLLSTVLALVAFGSKLKRWVWFGVLVGIAFAYGYCMWLMTQTLYDIGALCTYCIVIWVSSISMFWFTLKSYVVSFHSEKVSIWFERLWVPVMIVNFAVIAFMVYFRFETFFNGLFS